jgi:ADP-heptose:LPS heptosyltransferase
MVSLAGGGWRPRSVVVLRALMLGDLLCATPALRALRAAWPEARITLVGLPWARELAHRLPSLDAFEPFPGWPGFAESPEPTADAACAFIARIRAQRHDLALQMHGSGEQSNAPVAAFGAQHSAGLAAPAAWRPAADAAHYARWPERGHEIERVLALTDQLGLPRQGTHLDFPLSDADRRRVAPWVDGARPYALLHPGAQLASRRWPLERFAAVGRALAARGLALVVTGSAAETPRVDALVQSLGERAIGLAGRTSLGDFGALIEGAALVVCNDSGASHVAAALGTPSVVVASGSEVARWAPLDARRHRVLWHDTDCRPCAHPVCPQPRHRCAEGVSSAAVIDAALTLLQGFGAQASARAPAPAARPASAAAPAADARPP